MKNTLAAVSVIIPNFNHGRFLSERIESVLNESFTDFECIVLDDASKDNSKKIIEWYAERDTRIKFYPYENNSGSTFAQWNKGVSFSNNDFIWIAESDDFAYSHFIKKVSGPLLEEDSIVLSFCQSYCVDESSCILDNWSNYISDDQKIHFEKDFIMDGKEFIDRFLIHKNVIPNASAVIFRKDIYDKIGGADEDLKSNGDWLVWLKMLCHGKVAFIAEPLNYFRIHDDSVIGKLKSNIPHIDYKEQYDRTLRLKFRDYLYSNKIDVSKRLMKANNLFISYDDGNEGLFLIKKREYLQGVKKVISSTFKPTFKTGYLKKMFQS